jgi:hypothetical protein
MKKIAVTAATLAALAAGGLGLATNAAAIPLSGEPADQAVRALESEGYTVRINQSISVPLSQCTVLGISGLRGTEANGVLLEPSRLNVASVDVNCPAHS